MDSRLRGNDVTCDKVRRGILLCLAFGTPAGNNGNRRQGLRHRKHDTETDQTLPAQGFRPGQISNATPRPNSNPSFNVWQVPRKLTVPRVRRTRGWRIQVEQRMRHSRSGSTRKAGISCSLHANREPQQKRPLPCEEGGPLTALSSAERAG